MIVLNSGPKAAIASEAVPLFPSQSLRARESAEPVARGTGVRQEHRLSEWQGVQAGSPAGEATYEVSCEKTAEAGRTGYTVT